MMEWSLMGWVKCDWESQWMEDPLVEERRESDSDRLIARVLGVGPGVREEEPAEEEGGAREEEEESNWQRNEVIRRNWIETNRYRLKG
jgi:hypothetical protein